ncbi:MAG: hypothetical protein ACOH16_12375 [Propionibacteriaceae bacterium]
MRKGAVARSAALAVASVLWLTIGSGTAVAAAIPAVAPFVEPVVRYGASDARSIALLSGSLYVNSKMAGGGLPFWWDHSDLTATVLSAPTTDAEDVAAVHDAIALWRSVLAARLPGVSLTDVSTDSRKATNADIVVHLVPHAGGIVWGGSAVCGPQKCRNVLVRSDEPRGQDFADFTPLRVQREALHELGHALGLGHASPLDPSTDIMGYGWALVEPNLVPFISDCDLLGIKTAFGWYFNGEPPHASPVPYVTCTR